MSLQDINFCGKAQQKKQVRIRAKAYVRQAFEVKAPDRTSFLLFHNRNHDRFVCSFIEDAEFISLCHKAV